ncbi:MAG: MerR family transcriptional regulator [Eubacteriales bacterium]|nr:MerR family transcriptional regulator [Eubacteriales bacterium]
MDSKRYMISDAAKLVDVESHVLRYWEDELELSIGRNEMGHRCYTEDNIRMFHRIKDLKEQGFQLKAIKVLLPEVEQGRTPPAVIPEPEPPVSDKMEQFQVILGKVVSQALKANQQEMGKELSHQVSTQVVKEMDYLFRLQEEREETHYKKLDEQIRASQQKQIKERKPFFLGKKQEKKPKEPKIKAVKENRTADGRRKPWFFAPRTEHQPE